MYGLWYFGDRSRPNGLLVFLTILTYTSADTIFFKGETDVILVQISFDGNFSSNPPNVINDSLFRKLKKTPKVSLKLKAYINIIYADEYDYIDCEINREAREKLCMLFASNS